MPPNTLSAPMPAACAVDPADPQFLLKAAIAIGLSDRQFRAMLNATAEERAAAIHQIDGELRRHGAA